MLKYRYFSRFSQILLITDFSGKFDFWRVECLRLHFSGGDGGPFGMVSERELVGDSLDYHLQ